MDERIEYGDDTSAVAHSAFGRREMLQRTGFVLGAAALWATPVVQTLGMRSAAAGSPEGADFCVKCVGAPPVELIFEYDPSDDGEVSVGGVRGGCDEYALEFAAGDVPVETADIKVVMGQGNTETLYFCGVEVGQRIQVVRSAGSLTPRIEATITGQDAESEPQVIRIHTSCSSELRIEDVFKSLILKYGEDGDGFTAGTKEPFIVGSTEPCTP